MDLNKKKKKIHLSNSLSCKDKFSIKTGKLTPRVGACTYDKSTAIVHETLYARDHKLNIQNWLEIVISNYTTLTITK